MNYTLTIRVIIMAKNHQYKMKKIEIIGKRPAFNKNFSPIGKDIVILKTGQ